MPDDAPTLDTAAPDTSPGQTAPSIQAAPSSQPTLYSPWFQAPQHDPGFQPNLDPGSFQHFADNLQQISGNFEDTRNAILAKSGGSLGQNLLRRLYGLSEDWGEVISPEQANKEYGIPGQLSFDQPITRLAANFRADKAQRDMLLAWSLGNGNTSNGRDLSTLAAGLVGGFLQPENVASFLLPGVGEERFAAMVGKLGLEGRAATAATRISFGGFEGTKLYAGGQTLANYGATPEQLTRNQEDMVSSLGFSAAFAALLHTGFGALADRLKGMDFGTKDAAMKATVNDILADKPVETPAKIINLDPEIVKGDLPPEATEGMKPEEVEQAAAREQQARIQDTIEERKAEIRNPPPPEAAEEPQRPPEKTAEQRATEMENLNRQMREQQDMVVPKEIPKVETPVYQPTAQPTAEDFKLPKDLAGAAPRYGYGENQFTLKFDSPLDKALYIIAQKEPSVRDGDYLQAVMAHTGMDEESARNQGRVVRAKIKALAKESKSGELKIPQIYETPHAEAPTVDKGPLGPARDVKGLLGELTSHPDEFVSMTARNLAKISDDERLNTPVRYSEKQSRPGQYDINRDYIGLNPKTATPLVKLHEIFHALTSRNIEAQIGHLGDLEGRDYLDGLRQFIGQSQDAKDPVQSSVAELAKSYLYFIDKSIMPEYGADFIDGLNTHAGEGDLPHYGLRDVHEFVDEAMTNQKFQQVLADTPAPNSQKTVLKWFVNSVKKMLGFTAKENAGLLERVLDEGAQLASQPDTSAGEGGKVVGSAPAEDEADPAARLAEARNERRKILNDTAFNRMRTDVASLAEKSQTTYGKALEAYINGSERRGAKPATEGTGAGRSMDSEIRFLTQTWEGKFINALEAQGVSDRVKARDLQFDQKVYREFDQLQPGGQPGASGDPDAAKVAKIIYDLRGERNEFLRSRGAEISDRDDYRVRQSYDADEMRLVGRENPGWSKMNAEQRIEASYQVFKRDFLNAVDKGKTFVGQDGTPRDIETTLRNAYRGIITGIHGPLEDLGISGGVTEGGNMAEKMNQPRLFHFKSGDAAFAINAKYGQKDLLGAVLAEIRNAAHSSVVLDRFGVNPEANFDRARAQLRQDASKLPNFDEHMKSLESKAIDNSFKTIMGHLNRPSSITLARLGTNIRSLMNLRSLGQVITSVFGPDRAFAVHELSLNNIQDPVATAMKSFAPMSPEAKALGRSMGAGVDGFTGSISGQFNDLSDNKGALSAASQKMMSMTGYAKSNDAVRTMLVNAFSHNLAENAHLSMAEMPEKNPALSSLLLHYGVTPEEWDLLREHKTEVEGKSYITPDMARLIPDAKIDALLAEQNKVSGPFARAKAVNDLYLKIGSLLTDRANHGDPRATNAERSLLLAGTQAGTPLGETVRLAGQFKQWPVAIANKIWGGELYGNGANSARGWLTQNKFGNWRIAQLAALTAVGGYVALSAKALANGLTPPDPTRRSTWQDSFVHGGGLGIAGDMLFREYGRSYDNIFKEMAGPSLGQIPDVLNAGRTALVGSPKGSRTSRFYPAAKLLESDALLPAANYAGARLLSNFGESNLIKNTLYIKPALDYLVLWNLNEMLHPGGFRTAQKYARQENNQNFVLRPTSAPATP